MDLDDFDEFGQRVKPAAPKPAVPKRPPTSVSAAPSAQPAQPPPPNPLEPFGEGVEIVVDDDTADVNEPLVQMAPQAFPLMISDRTKSAAEPDFIDIVTSHSDRVRNVAFVGHLHHGKTSLMKDLFGSSLQLRPDEVEREITVKAKCVSGLLQGCEKPLSVVINAFDTPGHCDFVDECAVAMRIVDCVILCVDCAEGSLSGTEQKILQAASEGLPVALVITKLDRLILEMHLPPRDAYEKLKHVIDIVNNSLMACGVAPVSPALGSVFFSSSAYGIGFTLQSFARMYSERNRGVEAEGFAKRLWGPVALNEASRKFVPLSTEHRVPTFVTFVLEPLYKLFAHGVGWDGQSVELEQAMEKLGKFALHVEDSSPAAHIVSVVKPFFHNFVPQLVDFIIANAPSPASGNSRILQRSQGIESDINGVTVLITQLVASSSSRMQCIGRILRGPLDTSKSLHVIDDAAQDSTIAHTIGAGPAGTSATRVSASSISFASGGSLNRAHAGMIVSLTGVDLAVTRCALLVETLDSSLPRPSMTALSFSPPNMVLPIEPLKPSQLPLMKQGLLAIRKTFPGCVLTVENTGEHTIHGFGELYLEVVMHDLRKYFVDGAEIRVHDVYVNFRESVDVADFNKRVLVKRKSANDKNSLNITAHSLAAPVVNEIEERKFALLTNGERAERLRGHGWDRLASQGLWAFGPEPDRGANVFVNDCLAGEIDDDAREHLVQGFRWATQQGPLCGEPVRGTCFSLIDATLDPVRSKRGGQVLLPMSRRCISAAILANNPRLLEPVSSVEIITRPRHIAAIVEKVIGKRRGAVVRETPLPGTPFSVLVAHVPSIDTPGLETDIRLMTKGEAFPMTTFAHWDAVPGDPFDRTSIVQLYQAAEGVQLAHDFVQKTRRKKGLPPEIGSFE